MGTNKISCVPDRSRRALLALGAVLLLGACSSSSNTNGALPTTSGTASPSTTSLTGPTSPSTADSDTQTWSLPRTRLGMTRAEFSLDGVDGPSDEPAQGRFEAPECTLTDVKVGDHEGYERVVFTFSNNGFCRYSTWYSDSTHLRTNLEKTSNQDGRPPTGEEFADASVELTGIPRGSPVRSVEVDTVPEGPYGWTITVDELRAFRVYQLSAPPRLVVDIWKFVGHSGPDWEGACGDDCPSPERPVSAR